MSKVATQAVDNLPKWSIRNTPDKSGYAGFALLCSRQAPRSAIEHRRQRRPRLSPPPELRPSLCSHRSKRALPHHSQSGRRCKECGCRAGLASQYCSVIKNESEFSPGDLVKSPSILAASWPVIECRCTASSALVVPCPGSVEGSACVSHPIAFTRYFKTTGSATNAAHQRGKSQAGQFRAV